MGKIGRFLKFTLKWLAIAVAVYVGETLFIGLDFETRTGWFLAGLAIAIAYVDGTQKDRISDLEIRINRLERRLGCDVRQHPFD